MKKKPAAKKMPRKSAKVTFKEVHDTPDWETIKNKKEVKISVPPGLEFNKSYTPEEMREAMSKAEKKSEAKKEFGTPSSPKARHEEKYSLMSKRELEILGRKYGVEVDRRLRKATIIRIIELAEEAHKKEQSMMEDTMHKKLLQAIFIGIVIGLAMGVLFGYGIGIR